MGGMEIFERLAPADVVAQYKAELGIGDDDEE